MIPTAATRVGRAPIWSMVVEPQGVGVAEISGIPTYGSVLEISGLARSTTAGTGTDQIRIRFNGDTGNNYAWEQQYANQAAVGAVQTLTQPFFIVGEALRAGDRATYGDFFECFIPFYANSVFYKGALIHFTTLATNAMNTAFYDQTVSGRWANSSPICRVELVLASGLYVQGTQFFARVY